MKLYNIKGIIIDSVSICDTEIVIKGRNPRRSATCPYCGQRTSRLHQRKNRRVIHDQHNDRAVILELTIRRFLCSLCQRPFTERNIPGITASRFSEYFKEQVIQKTKTASFDEVSRHFRVSPPTVVEFLRQRSRRIPWPEGPLRLGIDGHSFSGRKMKTTIGDIGNRQLLAVLSDGGKQSLLKYLNSLSEVQKRQIFEVCIDMDQGYLAAITEALPEAKVVIDHFHVIKELLRKMDEIRKILQSQAKPGNRRIDRFLLLKNKENLNQAERKELERVFQKYEKFPTLKLTWWVKEAIREMYACPDIKTAERKFEQILWQLEDYEVGVPAEIYRMLRRWGPYMLNYFHHRTTNAFAEGCNNKIKVTKRISYGFRNFENYVLKITLALAPFVFLGGSLPH